MSSVYYNSSGKEVSDGNIAFASDLNTINSAVDSGFQLAETNINAMANNASYYANLSSTSATAAAASATSASTSATNSSTSATASSTSSASASTSATNASTSASTASAAATTATAARDKAEKWAEEAVDIPVETGKYSAKHWAAKAQVSAGLQTLTGTGVDNSDPNNPVITITKTTISLGNVDNTSDANKPVSTATQSALGLKENSLGNPASNGYVLSSTAAGVRSWILVSAAYNDVLGGDITVSGSTLTITPCKCWDSTRAVFLETTGNKTLVLPSGAGTESDLWLIAQVRLVADSSITFKYYADLATIAADAVINAYRIIDVAQNNSGGTAAKSFMTKNGVHWNLKASESAVNSLGTVPANCNTAISLAAFLPPADMVDSVLPGAAGSGADQYIVFGVDGTNSMCLTYSGSSATDDTNIYSWGGSDSKNKFIPVLNNTLYWGRGTASATGTHKALLQAFKLRR